ncbi:hypothetical protein B0H14DRAFT_3489842 [Mycena olivaceomarginata]|nr:hypothetical protein B0H14DRAFT_3489842 [Mycena olivaceomarginata]
MSHIADTVFADAEYVVSVKIGTPGVTLNLDFDTVSSDLWVWRCAHIPFEHSYDA